MPYFEYDGDVDIDVDDFLAGCSSKEIEELIDGLVASGHIKSSRVIHDSEMSIPEQLFQEALTKLDGKWNRLTKEEEQIITSLANKF